MTDLLLDIIENKPMADHWPHFEHSVLQNLESDSLAQYLVSKTPTVFRDGPLENLWGGGGGAEDHKKKIRARENYMKKNSCTPINPKKYSC